MYGGRADTGLVGVSHGAAVTLFVNPDSAIMALGSQQQVQEVLTFGRFGTEGVELFELVDDQ